MRPLAALLACALAACGSSDSPTPSPSPSSSPSRFEFNGINHVSFWHDEYQYPDAGVSRRELAATRANWAGVLVTWYMARRDASQVAPDPQRTPTDAAVRQAIAELRGQGLKVMLKPHVDVQDGTWRGTIAPADETAWFASYAAFVSRYAALAQETGAELFCVGTELVTLSGARHAGSWSAVIAAVRGRYGGPLTYAANAVSAADEFTSVSFWAQLDYLGLDAYTPLTDALAPTRQQLAAGWSRNRFGENMLAAFRNWQASWNKPVLFTEIGYRSGDGANRAPWDFGVPLAPDTGEQADCYAAAFEVWTREAAWMRGLFWWSWSVPVPAAGDTGYEPRRKPAEDVLRQWQGS
ncbi:MAG TPA: hypothetical protein VFM88_12955 [Vicinamibacteria bacterium]|nr:hypothetical protein [Vicinamibacteria bacterium]